MSVKPACLFLDRDSIDCDDLDFSALKTVTELVTLPACRDDQLVAKAASAEIIIVNKVVLSASHFSALPALKLICVIATGTNNIDLQAASRHGIIVCNVRDYAAASVSQHVFMLILSLYTRFLDYQADVRNGAWQSQEQFCLLNHPMRELKGKMLGLVGYGHIARAVEKIALAFGMQVQVAQSVQREAQEQPGRIPFDEFLQSSDIISVHCPLSEHTRDLIRRPQLAMMKNDAILINTARGGIINEEDLLEAIKTGQIGGAGIDCLETEPPAATDPMISSQYDRLIVTPHNAWGTLEARQRLLDGTVQNIRDYLQGQVKTRVNP